MAYSPTLKAEALNKSLHKMFLDGVESAKKAISQIMDVVYVTNSDGPSGVYILAETLSAFRDRDDSDAMIADPVTAHEVEVTNARKYRRVHVPLPDLLDDRIGKYELKTRQFGRLAVTGPVFDMEKFAEKAATTICHDGVALCATNHPRDPHTSGSPTWSNKLTQAGGLTIDNFGVSLAAMRKFPDADGNPLGSAPTHILVSADSEGLAMDIAKSRFPSGLQGAENKWLGLGLEVIVVKSWTTDHYMLIDASDEVERPFIFQEREPVQMVDICTDPRSQWAIDKDCLAWAVMGRYGLGVGYPSKVLLSVKS